MKKSTLKELRKDVECKSLSDLFNPDKFEPNSFKKLNIVSQHLKYV